MQNNTLASPFLLKVVVLGFSHKLQKLVEVEMIRRLVCQIVIFNSVPVCSGIYLDMLWLRRSN